MPYAASNLSIVGQQAGCSDTCVIVVFNWCRAWKDGTDQWSRINQVWIDVDIVPDFSSPFKVSQQVSGGGSAPLGPCWYVDSRTISGFGPNDTLYWRINTLWDTIFGSFWYTSNTASFFTINVVKHIEHIFAGKTSLVANNLNQNTWKVDIGLNAYSGGRYSDDIDSVIVEQWLDVDTSPNFGGPAMMATKISGVMNPPPSTQQFLGTFTFQGLEPNTLYYARVNSNFSTINGNKWIASPTISFTTAILPVPSAAHGLSAVVGSQEADGTYPVTFSWLPSSNCQSVILDVSTDPGFSTLFQHVDVTFLLTATLHGFAGGYQGLTYYARLVSGCEGQILADATIQFSVALPTPIMAANLNAGVPIQQVDETWNVDLRWSAASYCDSIVIDIATDSGFSNIIQHITLPGTATRVTVQGLIGSALGRTYWARLVSGCEGQIFLDGVISIDIILPCIAASGLTVQLTPVLRNTDINGSPVAPYVSYSTAHLSWVPALNAVEQWVGISIDNVNYAFFTVDARASIFDFNSPGTGMGLANDTSYWFVIISVCADGSHLITIPDAGNPLHTVPTEIKLLPPITGSGGLIGATAVFIKASGISATLLEPTNSQFAGVFSFTPSNSGETYLDVGTDPGFAPGTFNGYHVLLDVGTVTAAYLPVDTQLYARLNTNFPAGSADWYPSEVYGPFIKTGAILPGASGIFSVDQVAQVAVRYWPDRTTALNMVTLAYNESRFDNHAHYYPSNGGPLYSCIDPLGHNAAGVSHPNDPTDLWSIWQILIGSDKAGFLRSHTGSSDPCVWATWLQDISNAAAHVDYIARGGDPTGGTGPISFSQWQGQYSPWPQFIVVAVDNALANQSPPGQGGTCPPISQWSVIFGTALLHPDESMTVPIEITLPVGVLADDAIQVVRSSDGQVYASRILTAQDVTNGIIALMMNVPKSSAGVTEFIRIAHNCVHDTSVPGGSYIYGVGQNIRWPDSPVPPANLAFLGIETRQADNAKFAMFQWVPAFWNYRGPDKTELVIIQGTGFNARWDVTSTEISAILAGLPVAIPMGPIPEFPNAPVMLPGDYGAQVVSRWDEDAIPGVAITLTIPSQEGLLKTTGDVLRASFNLTIGQARADTHLTFQLTAMTVGAHITGSLDVLIRQSETPVTYPIVIQTPPITADMPRGSYDAVVSILEGTVERYNTVFPNVWMVV